MTKLNLQELMDAFMLRIFDAAFKHILEKIEEPPTNTCSPEPCEAAMPKGQLVPNFTTPYWMPQGWWIAQEKSGIWYLYSDKPTFDGQMWSGSDKFAEIPDCLNWVPPVVDSPENSLHYLA